MALPGRHSAFKEEAPGSGVVKRFGGMNLHVARACVRNYMGSCKASPGSVTSSQASREACQSPGHQPLLWHAHCPASPPTKEHPQKLRPPIYVLRKMGRQPRGSVLSHTPPGVNKKDLTERNQTQTLPPAAYRPRNPTRG